MLLRVRKCSAIVLQWAVRVKRRGARKMILIGLGGNLASVRFGPPRATLAAALRELEAESVNIVGLSRWYRGEPVPRSEQPWFVNAVASLSTGLGAVPLLALLQTIEAQFGRI